MYYKVIKDNQIIDILDQIFYLKYQPKHRTMILTDLHDAQAILSSSKRDIWHVSSLKPIPVKGYDTVELIKIDKYEYEELKRKKMMTYEDIYDSVIMELIQEGVI